MVFLRYRDTSTSWHGEALLRCVRKQLIEDYCDVFLTHDSTSVRKAHNCGRNHLQNVRDYYACTSFFFAGELTQRSLLLRFKQWSTH